MSGGSRDRRSGDGAFTVVLAGAALVLAVLVVLLAIQNRALKRDLAAAHAGEDLPRLTVGDTVEPLTLTDDAGARWTLDWSTNSRTLVVVFTSTCPACADTLPVWDDLADRLADRGSVRIVGLQLDRPDASGGQASAIPPGAHPFPIHGIDREPNRSFLDLVPYIPATVVVDATGTVRLATFGVLDAEAVEAVVVAVTPGAR